MANTMHPEKLNLNWHTFEDHVKEMLHEMMKSDELTDVTLVSDDKQEFKAHKVVLSSCSSVFKSIINNHHQNNPIIYLRGIQHQEMESVLEFMYLGKATFHPERMDEFLNVAKNLEIKTLLNYVDSEKKEFDKNDVNTEPTNEPGEKENFAKLPNEHSLDNEELLPKNSLLSTKPQGRGKKWDTDSDGKYTCEKCQKQFAKQKSFRIHIESIHEGVKHACMQCNFEATQKTHLRIHIQAKHEGVVYECEYCTKKYTLKSKLTRHIQSQHNHSEDKYRVFYPHLYKGKE